MLRTLISPASLAVSQAFVEHHGSPESIDLQEIDRHGIRQFASSNSAAGCADNRCWDCHGDESTCNICQPYFGMGSSIFKSCMECFENCRWCEKSGSGSCDACAFGEVPDSSGVCIETGCVAGYHLTSNGDCCWGGDPSCEKFDGTVSTQPSMVLQDSLGIHLPCNALSQGIFVSALSRFLPVNVPRIAISKVSPTVGGYEFGDEVSVIDNSNRIATHCSLDLTFNLMASDQRDQILTMLRRLEGGNRDELMWMYSQIDSGSERPSNLDFYLPVTGFECNEMDDAHWQSFYDAVLQFVPINQNDISVGDTQEGSAAGLTGILPCCDVHVSVELGAVDDLAAISNGMAQIKESQHGDWFNSFRVLTYVDRLELPFILKDHIAISGYPPSEMDAVHLLAFRKAMALFAPVKSYHRVHPTNMTALSLKSSGLTDSTEIRFDLVVSDVGLLKTQVVDLCEQLRTTRHAEFMAAFRRLLGEEMARGAHIPIPSILPGAVWIITFEEWLFGRPGRQGALPGLVLLLIIASFVRAIAKFLKQRASLPHEEAPLAKPPRYNVDDRLRAAIRYLRNHPNEPGYCTALLAVTSNTITLEHQCLDDQIKDMSAADVWNDLKSSVPRGEPRFIFSQFPAPGDAFRLVFVLWEPKGRRSTELIPEYTKAADWLIEEFQLEDNLACKRWEDVDNASNIRAELDDWTGLGLDADEM
jgi:hypothetical protein